MKLTLTGAGIKIRYTTLSELVQKVKAEYDKAKAKEGELINELIEVRKNRTFFETVLKQHTETPLVEVSKTDEVE